MPASMRAWSPRGTSRRTSSTGGWSRRPAAPGLGGARERPPAGLMPSSAVLGLAVGLGDPWACCRGVVVLGCAAGAWVPVGLLLGSVSTERNMSRYVRPARRSRWGSVHGAQINQPDAPGLVVAGSRWVLSVPRLFLCVGALHPIRRQCTSSVRVQCPISGVAPLIGCSAPDRV